jgi:flagella basal body P-ring formation protein FlgA
VESTSQEYAKTVTEEASKRVKSSIKESTSITILTETQDTSLRGFNNEKGTTHINGLYRWVDKIYDAQLLNYGRRLMFSLNVPEPAAFYRALILQNEAAAMADLVEPLHPSRIGRGIVAPLPESNTTGGFLSYQHINEGNYAELAAFYDVSVQPPPPEYLTGSKAFVYPDAMASTEIKPHDQVNDLSYVTSDNTLTLDPNYRLSQVSVYAPVGSTGEFGSYVNALKLGEVVQPAAPNDGTTIAEANLILVQVANKSFYMSVRRDPDDADQKIISTNFNSSQLIEDDWKAFGEVVRPAIPITITANFEGILTFTVVYQAYRLDEAYDAWKSGTFAAIIKGYNAKKQAYDQAVTLAQSKAQSSTEAKTFQLRDDQYRSIELTELKRGCIDLLTEGTATGYTSIAVAEDGTPDIVYDAAQGALLGNWRSPLANGSVAEFFELAFEWENTTYQFYPYYWAGTERWKDLAQASGADPVFEQFLRSGNASVVVPVRPGYERPVIFFLKTGLLWGGGYLSLFTSQDMLDVYADVELGRQFDPPLQIGDPWEIRLPTSMVMLQEDGALPVFPPEPATEEPPAVEEPVPDESVPF